jgi:hypothetical protein
MIRIILFLIFLPLFSYCQEHARILDHTTKYNILNNEEVEIEEFYKITINSEKGDAFSIYQDYSDQFRKIVSITLDVFDKNNKKVKRLRRIDGREFGFNPSYEINDSKVLVINPDYKQYPYTVEINSKVKLKGFISLSTWIPRPYFNIAVNHSKLTIIRPPQFKIKFKEENINSRSKSFEKDSVTQYEVSNLTHVDKKMRYEDFYKDQPKVFVSPERFRLNDAVGSNSSWVDFGNWFLTLNTIPYTLSKETRNHVDSLRKGNREQLIKGIYEYMQNRTRYVSIQLGIGGFKSLPTEEVDKHGYGDCKALTTYMKNMLDYAGIKSNYILVSAGKDVPDVIADFPSNQFNHVFLGIPLKDTIFLECTSQISPANYIGSFTDDRNVLWIEDNKSSIIRSRVYSHLNSIQNNTSKVILDDKGNATIELDVINQGVFFDEVMLYKLAPSDFVKDHNQEKFNYNDFTIKNFRYDQPDKNSSFFNSKYLLQVNGLAKIASDKFILPIIPTVPIQKYIQKDDLMKFYSIKRGITVVDEIQVTIPQNYWIYNLPSPQEVNSEYGSYQLITSFDGNSLKIKRKVVLFKGDYTKESYEHFKAFYQKLERIETSKLVLNSKT